ASTCTPSSRLTVARPVRTDAMSRRTRSMAPSMRVFTSPNMPFKSLKSISAGWWLLVGRSWLADRRADRFAHDHAADVAGLAQVEDDNRQLVVHAERDGRGVHHLELSFEHLQVGDCRVFRRLRVEHRVGGVHAIHLRPLEDDLGLDLHG